MRIACALALFLASVAPAAAAPINVAQGKPVTVTGDLGELVNLCCGWGEPPVAPLSTITDGLFLAEGHVWQDGCRQRPILVYVAGSAQLRLEGRPAQP